MGSDYRDLSVLRRLMNSDPSPQAPEDLPAAEYQGRTDEELIDSLLGLQRAREQVDADAHSIEQELAWRMSVNKASEIAHPRATCIMQYQTKVDEEALLPLLELIGTEELEAAGAFTPSHTETITVPAKWNRTHLSPFAKLGGEQKRIITEKAVRKFVIGIKVREKKEGKR